MPKICIFKSENTCRYHRIVAQFILIKFKTKKKLKDLPASPAGSPNPTNEKLYPVDEKILSDGNRYGGPVCILLSISSSLFELKKKREEIN